jgi:DNA-directed RNA polymerase specialized sigma54-like protein
MSSLSPRLQLKVAQKQILTPSLVQMVKVLQLNRLELREMIDQEIAENPLLEESVKWIASAWSTHPHRPRRRARRTRHGHGGAPSR